jgi:hypothetical protein
MSTNVSIERRYGVVSADERRALGGLEFALNDVFAVFFCVDRNVTMNVSEEML